MAFEVKNKLSRVKIKIENTKKKILRNLKTWRHRDQEYEYDNLYAQYPINEPSSQCDQKAELFDQFLAVYKNENLPNSCKVYFSRL